MDERDGTDRRTPADSADGLDAALVATLSTEADRVAVPVCRVDELLDRARLDVRQHHRRVRWTAAVAAAAAACLVAVGVTVGLSAGSDGTPLQPVHSTGPTASHQTGKRPTSPARLPVSAPVPFWIHGALHADGRTVRMREPQIAFAAGFALVTPRRVSATSPVLLVVGNRVDRIGSTTSDVAISSDGRFGAWESANIHDQVTLQLWDLQSGSLVAHVSFHSHEACCDAPSVPVGIDAHERVYVQDGAVPLVWDPDSGSVKRISGAPGSLLAGVYADGAVFPTTARDQSAELTYGTVSSQARFAKAGVIPTFDQMAWWSPSGYEAATVPAARDHPLEDGKPTAGYRVLMWSLGSSRGFALPIRPMGSAQAEAVYWASDNFVYVAESVDQHTLWLGCEVTAQSCERLGRTPIGATIPH